MVEDETARQALEAALQEMEVALGLRQKQQSELDGTLDEAKVLSIDTESGLIVINAGSKGGVKVGMPMEISRGNQLIADTMVTDVRKSVSGLLVQRHLNPVLSIAVGDRVSVKIND
jgi:cell shape-determining protein MreC